ncbi:MAG: sodium/solute symporter [Opitutaceae bacterium]
MNLTTLDWLVLGVYMVGILVTAHSSKGGRSTLAQYFLADRSLSWFTVGLCLYATLFSTVSFVAIPGEAYKNGVLFSLNSIGYALFTPLAVWMFLRFFYRTSSFTAYEYLERRFDRGVRIWGAGVFLIARLLYLAVVFYSAASIFETLLGWPPWLTVVAVGLFTVYYSYHGGMKAIALTDVVQSLIIFGAIAFILVKLSLLVDFDYAGLWTAVQQGGRGYGTLATPEFYSFDPRARYTAWTALALALIGPLTNYGTDQLFVQRMLSTKTYAAAKQAIWLKTLVALPVSLSLYAIGLLLYFYYDHVVKAPLTVPGDQLLGFFIREHMPAPMPGIVAAALLAALMSTVSSTAATLATVTTVDLLAFVPGWKERTELGSVAWGRWLTVVWGLAAMGLALVLTYAGRTVESTVLEVAQVWSGLWLILLVVVLYGIFTRWATARGARVALMVGIVCNLTAPYLLYYRVPAAERISFVWVSLPGFLIAALLLGGVSLFDRRKTRDLTGLTFRTVSASIKSE